MSLDTVPSGLVFFTESVGDECSKLEDFLSGAVFTTPALWPSTLWSAAVSSSGLCGGAGEDPAPELEGVVPVVPVVPVVELEGVVPVVPVVPVVELEGVVPVVPVVELEGVVPVVPVVELEGVVPVVPVVEPEGVVPVVLDVVDVSEAGAAHATPGDNEIADPMPKATANAPTRPT